MFLFNVGSLNQVLKGGGCNVILQEIAVNQWMECYPQRLSDIQQGFVLCFAGPEKSMVSNSRDISCTKDWIKLTSMKIN